MTIELINKLLQALLVAMAAPTLMNSQPFKWTLKTLRLEKKPFNCLTCLPAWVMLLLQVILWKTTLDFAIITALATGWLSNEADKIHTRIF